MVKHWETIISDDGGNRDQNAQVEGSDIVFIALPSRDYFGQKGDYLARVGRLFTKNKWFAEIQLSETINGKYTGKSVPIRVLAFESEDEAFEWADKFINDRNRLFGKKDQ